MSDLVLVGGLFGLPGVVLLYRAFGSSGHWLSGWWERSVTALASAVWIAVGAFAVAAATSESMRWDVLIAGGSGAACVAFGMGWWLLRNRRMANHPGMV